MAFDKRITIHPLILREFGKNIVNISGESELIYHCPFCEKKGKSADVRGKLYVNNVTLKFHCFRCQTSGSLVPKGQESSFIRRDITDDKLAELMQNYLRSTFINYQKIKKITIKLEYEIPKLYPVQGSHEYEYLKSRGITDEQIQYYDIRVGSSVGRYANRIIIPNRVYHKDNGLEDLTDMFVARYTQNIPNDDVLIQRYLNPFGKNRSLVVFNLHRIVTDCDRLIITEGCMTAIAAGKDAVACYGKQITNVQLDQILSKQPKRLYLNLDPDAYYEMIKLAFRIKRRKPDLPLYIVRFKREDGEHADACDVGTEKYQFYLEEARLFNFQELQLMGFLGLNHIYLDDFLKLR